MQIIIRGGATSRVHAPAVQQFFAHLSAGSRLRSGSGDRELPAVGEIERGGDEQADISSTTARGVADGLKPYLLNGGDNCELVDADGSIVGTRVGSVFATAHCLCAPLFRLDTSLYAQTITLDFSYLVDAAASIIVLRVSESRYHLRDAGEKKWCVYHFD